MNGFDSRVALFTISFQTARAAPATSIGRFINPLELNIYFQLFFKAPSKFGAPTSSTTPKVLILSHQ